MIKDRDECIGCWTIVECEHGKLWIEHDHSMSSFELDESRPSEHAKELIAELEST